jgi:tetratricopeptide (TPR) repeat protein
LLLAPLGRFDEAFTEFKRAIRLDPLSPIIHAAYSWAYYCAHLYREAKEEAERTLDLDTNFTPGWYALGTASMFNGEEALGLSAFQRAVDLSSGAGAYLSGLGWAFAKLGRRDEADEILEQLLKRRTGQNYVMALQIAIIYAELRDLEAALTWLENAYEERSAWMVYLKTDSRFDPLRSEPRFCELMRKMNFS